MNRRSADGFSQRLAGFVAWALLAGVPSLVLGLMVSAVVVFSTGLEGVESASGRASVVPGVHPSPFLLGAVTRTFLMSWAAIPAGFLTAVYLVEYAPPGARLPRILRCLVHGLAEVPGVVFGMMVLGLWTGAVGVGLDPMAVGSTSNVWGRTGLSGVSWSLAMMALPVMVVSTERALRSVPQEWRLAAMALGATRLQIVMRVLLPNAWTGIAGGVVLTLGRALGGVAPLLFAGVVVETGKSLALGDHFMDRAHPIHLVGTRSPEQAAAQPLLAACFWVLFFMSISSNAATAVFRTGIHRIHRVGRDRP